VPPDRLRLHAEMRLPGEAWLAWDLEPAGSGTEVTQTALFRPRGLLGRFTGSASLPSIGSCSPGCWPGYSPKQTQREKLHVVGE